MGAGASLQVESHSPNPLPPVDAANTLTPLQPPSVATAAASSSSTKQTFPFIGLKLSFHEEFILQCGGREALSKLSTKEVVERHILNQTNASQLSYCEMLQRMNHAAVSTSPTVYVIHCWGDNFLTVLDALRDRYSSASDVVLWWDIFCLNQHIQLRGHLIATTDTTTKTTGSSNVPLLTPRTSSLIPSKDKFQFDPYWIIKTIPSSIKRIGRVALVIAQWERVSVNINSKASSSSSSTKGSLRQKSILPTCLERTWCLYELFSASSVGGSDAKIELEIAISNTIKTSFLSTLSTEKSAFFNHWRDSNVIDLENSQCSHEDDQRLIVDHIQASKGDVILNNKVLERIRLALVEDVVVKAWSSVIGDIGIEGGESVLEERRRCQLALIDLMIQQGGPTYLVKAQTICLSALQEMKQTLGETHAETVKVILILSNILKSQGKLQESETLLKESLNKTIKEYTESHVIPLSIMNQLAELHIHIASNIKLGERKEKDNKEKEKERHLQEGERLHRAFYEKRRDLLGETDSETLKSLHSLAMTCLLQPGKHSQAETMLQECLTKRKSVLGLTHPDTFESLRALCFTCLELGKDDIAEKLILECREIVHHSMNCPWPAYQQQMINITFLTNLADLYYHKRHDYEKAEAIYVECLDYKMSKLSLHHPSTLSSWSDLAMFYLECGRRFEQEDDDHKQSLSAEEEQAAAILSPSKQQISKQQRYYRKAMELLTNCYDFVKKSLGYQHPFTMHCMMKLVEIYQVLQRYQDAVLIMERLLRCYRTNPSFGEKHSMTIQTYQDIGDLYYKQDEFEKAIHYYQECYDKRKLSLGDDHPKTIAACGNLAICYEKMQRNDRAEPLFTLYYQSVKKSLGETHPKTIAIGKNLQLMRANTAATASTASKGGILS